MVQYRKFRNDDPPGLAEIWNEAFAGRGAVRLRSSSPLERHVFAKPYFDPDGLIVALENGVRVGFAHAGFGPNETESRLSHDRGVICLIGLRPSFQRRGIGAELLQRCDKYLRERGATELHAGAMHPLNPFYFGLYGGSELPGFLDSDPATGPFLRKHGYQPGAASFIFQRRLDQPFNIADGRFGAIRRCYEMRLLPQIKLGTWWQECVLGLVEPVEVRLEEKWTGQAAATAIAWEMEGFSWRWEAPTVGVMNLQVREDLRRQGLGKFLMAQLIRHLQEQYFGLVEVQTMESNQAAIKLYTGLGFQHVDTGRIYRKQTA